MVPGPWVENWLSRPRFARYLADCGGDRERALETYEWNMRLGYALMRDAAHFEVALRNAYDRSFNARWQGSGHWLLDVTSPVQRPLWRQVKGRRVDVNVPNRKAIIDAARKSGGEGPSDAVLAQLPFGFWEHLADAVHEQTIWIPYVYYAWPTGTSRSQVDHAIHLVSTARNRAAHHEPVFAGTGNHSITYVCATINNLLSMLNGDLADYVQQTSTLMALWAEKP